MLSFPGKLRAPQSVLAAVLVAGLTACHGNVLDVNDPTITTPGQLSPNSVPTQMNGVVSDARNMLDWYTMYSGLLTDEYVLAGTFPTRLEVDERRPNPNNGSINGDVWQPMSVSRSTADRMVSDFSGVMNDPDFSGVQGELQQGIDLGRLVGGFDRILFSEMFCQSIFGGEDGEPAPVLPADRMQEAYDLLGQAAQSSDPNIQAAALVGQARAQMFLGNYGQASSIAQNVPVDFHYDVLYSTNTTGEENRAFQFTWGVHAPVRWTVGNGQDASRHSEIFPWYNEWVDQGLIIPPTQNNITAFNNKTPVSLQTVYGGADTDPDSVAPNTRSGAGGAAPILLATGWAAQMDIAEAQYRSGDMGGAATRINDLLTEADQADNPIRTVNPNVPFGAFQQVSFNGNLTHDLNEIARAREAGLWLSGDRLSTVLRYKLNDGVDFYPTGTDGDALQLPIPRAEIDHNSHLSSACPPGTPGIAGS